MNRNAIRFMLLAYLHKTQSQSLRDVADSGANLLRQEATELRKQIDGEYNEIVQISMGQQKHRMSTIREEDTDEDESDSIIGSFNKTIGSLKNTSRKISQTFVMYKEELKKLATDVYEWDRKNKELQAKMSKMKKKLEQLEDNHPPLFENTSQNSLPEKDKRIWEQLNNKIEQFKKSLKLYEQEIRQKDQIIENYKKDNKQESLNRMIDENKTLKRGMTTLRGQKSMLQNQLENLKKLLTNKQHLIQSQNSQLQKCRIDVQNLTATLRDNIENLMQFKTGYHEKSDVAQNHAKKLQRLEHDYERYKQQYPKGQFDRLRHSNEHLSRKVTEVEHNYQNLNQKLQEIENKYQGLTSADKKTIQQLQQILNQKNQTIVRLKASKTDDKYEYYVDLVKLLNKKLLDRDQYISELKKQYAM